MIVFVVLVGVVLVFFIRRRRRAVTMAGLNAERPQFLVEPPTRRMGSLKDRAL